MTTSWKRLTRRDLTTFDDFATKAVLTAMEQGGLGAIAKNGHAKIRGKNGAAMIIARDTSAPHCQGNVVKALRRTFPDLNGTTQKDITMTTTSPTIDLQSMLECPAKGCDIRFATADLRDAHVTSEHVVCKWEGCDYGPDGGAFVGRTNQAIAGHTNTRHRGNKPWEANREQAAVNRAATMARKRHNREEVAAGSAALMAAAAQATLASNAAELNGFAKAAAEANGEVSARPLDVPVDADAEVKLALIREILGDDEEVAKLKKKLADLKAQMALVREAAGLDAGDDN